MKFYLPAHCSADFMSFFAVIDIHDQLKKWLLKQRDLFREFKEKEDTIYQLVYWDSDIEWYESDHDFAKEDHDKLLKLVGEADLNDNVARLPDDFKMSDATSAARMECDRVFIDERGVYWKAYPKHTDSRVETELLRWEELEGA
jgi:hypothetical protein